jgi:trimeric autotransporter adhesin
MDGIFKSACVAALSLFPTLAFGGSFTDGGYWDSRFNTISSRAIVDVAADDSRRLLVWGQSLPVAVPLPGSVMVARWDGLRWDVLAKGGVPPNTVLARGEQIYAAGKFTSMNGVPAANIAEFRNGVWSPLAEGVNSTVNSIAVLGTNLLAGGSFTQAGSVAAPFVAKWNGTEWSAVGTGITGIVSRIATSADDAVAAWTTGVAVAISRLNGADWERMGTFAMKDGSAANVRAVLWTSAGLFAGGHFNAVDGQNVTNVARWDGTNWKQWAAGRLEGQVESFAAIGSRIFASGDLVEKQVGATNRFALAEVRESDFTKELNGEAKFGRTVTASGSELFVVTQPFLSSLSGTEQNFFTDTFGLIWHHNGDDWGLVSNIPQFLPGFHEIAESPEGLVGTVTRRVGFLTNPLIWTGKQFALTEVEPPADGGRIEMQYLMVEWNSAVYAQATKFKSGEPARDLLMSLTNRVWHSATLPLDGQITALGLYNGKIAAVVRTVDTVEHWNVWLWDGVAWTPIGGDFDGFMQAIATFKGELYVGGSAANSGGMPVNRLARFDGSNWSGVDGGVTAATEPKITRLTADGEKLYVGGFFQSAGGFGATNLATWDGVKWQPIPGFTNGAVSTLALSEEGLLAVGGNFRYVDGLDAGGVAIWNGSEWSTLGTNVVKSTGLNLGRALWRGRDLFVAGSFTSFDGILSQTFGIWHHPGLLLNIQFAGDSSDISIETTGAAPRDFMLEETSDFVNWAPLGSNSLGNNRPWIVNATSPNRFIRAKAVN